MVPHTLVLKPGLVIHSVYNGYWYWGRPSIQDLWSDLREVTREIRPDWDPAAPGLRENYGGATARCTTPILRQTSVRGLAEGGKDPNGR
jgi:hypothetical protein